MSKKKIFDDSIKARVNKKEKADFQIAADEVGTSMSNIIRQLIFRDEKFNVLAGGKKIASELYQIRMDLDHFIKNGSLPHEAIAPLMESLDSLSHEVFALSEKLTDIHPADELEE